MIGVPAYFWNNLEAGYRLVIAKNADKKKAEDEIDLSSKFPYSEIARLGFVSKTRKKVEKIQELRKFFGVSSLFDITSVKQYSPAFRQNEKNSLSHESLAAWLRASHILASQREGEVSICDNKKALRAALPKIRELTFETRLEPLLEKLSTLFSNCGVALIVIPHFSKTYTTGATFWQGKKAVVMMSLKDSWSDIFWFSLLHEIGHILLHDKRITFLENGSENTQYIQQELEANEFAKNCLIPEAEYKSFVDASIFTSTSINTFAKKLGIFLGIVTGRLQHDKKLPHTSHLHRIHFKF